MIVECDSNDCMCKSRHRELQAQRELRVWILVAVLGSLLSLAWWVRL